MQYIISRNSHLRTASHRNQVDAVPVALAVREIVAQMSAIKAHRLSIRQASHVLPNNLLVSERWPSVLHALFNKLLRSTTSRSNKKWLSSHAIVKCHLRSLRKLIKNHSRLHKSVAWMLCIVSVETANLVCSLHVTSKPEVLLNWLFCGAMSLRRHNRLIALEWVLIVLFHF